MKQSYSKPIVTRVELKAEEALLIACKTGGDIGNGWDVSSSACVPVACACRDASGS
jgi:hypothetical protein